MRDITGEHLTAQRDAAVARLSARLAKASDVDGVLSAGLTELAANWDTRRALILAWDVADQVSAIGTDTSWAVLPSSTKAAIKQIRTTGQPYWQSGDRLVDPPRPTVIGAPIPSGSQVNVVWLELDPIRPFDGEDAALVSDLAGHLGQAFIRARLFDEQRTASLTLQRAILGPTVLSPGLVERRHRPLDAGIGLARTFLTQCHHLVPAEIADCLAEHLLTDGHDDDVAYLIYQQPISVGASVTITVPAHLEQLAVLRRTLRQWLTATSVEQHIAHELVLAVGEAASNVVEHAYLDRDPGSIELTVSRETEELRLEVRDHGRWRTSPAPGPRGHGLKMIEKLTDVLAVDPGDHGTTVQIRKRLPL